jgi:hypothetical protein
MLAAVRATNTTYFRFSLASPARVQLRILREGAWVVTPLFAADLPPGPQVVTWDGKKRIGRPLDGAYAAELTVADAAGSIVQSIPFAVDATPPRLSLVSTRPLRLRVSEASELVVVADGARQVVRAAAPGVYAIPGARTPKRVRAVAWDRSGNSSRPALHPARR